jgi:hypothetical protein
MESITYTYSNIRQKKSTVNDFLLSIQNTCLLSLTFSTSLNQSMQIVTMFYHRENTVARQSKHCNFN